MAHRMSGHLGKATTHEGMHFPIHIAVYSRSLSFTTLLYLRRKAARLLTYYISIPWVEGCKISYGLVSQGVKVLYGYG